MFRQPDLTPVPPALDFRCESVERGGTFLGVVIGPLVKVRTHTFNGRSKPCLNFATEGKLRCWCNERAVSIRDVGYLPVINRDGDRVVVILSALAAYSLRSVKQDMLIRFSRPDKPKVRVQASTVTGIDAEQQWVKRARGLEPVEIWEYLCHVWQIHSLTKYLGFSVRRPLKVDANGPLDPHDAEPRYVSYTEKLLGEKPSDAEAA